MATERELTDEERRVESWRLHVLMEAGYPFTLAERLAAASHVDIHRAVQLLGEGCPAGTASEILL